MRWLYALVAIIALVVTIAATAPAAYFVQWLRAPGVSMAGVSGSLWTGSADRVNANGVRVTHLRWHVQPLAILLARLRFRVQAQLPDGSLSGVIDATPGGSGLSAHDLRLATRLSTLIEALGRGHIPVSGQLSVNLDHIEVKQHRLTAAHGTIAMGDAHWLLADPPLALGTFSAKIRQQGEHQVVAQIRSDGDNALRLRGRATLARDGRWQLDAKMKSTASAANALKNLLNALAPVSGNGWHHVKESGRW